MSQVHPEGSGFSKKKIIYIAAFFLDFCFLFFFPSSFIVYVQPSSLKALSSCSFWPIILPKNEQKHWQFPLTTFSRARTHTHTNKHRSHLPRMCAGTCDQVIINFSPLPRLLVSLTDATLISVCINTLRHHLHCGCEYCCSKKKKRKSRANGRKRKSQGSQKHHLWPLFFFHMYWLDHPCAKGFKKYTQ